jgi:hypothetical protein
MTKEDFDILTQYNKRERKITPIVFAKWREDENNVNIYSSVYNSNIHYAIEYLFIDYDLVKVKECYSACGLIDEYCVNHFNSKFLDYDFHHVCYALLSDNEEMIQRYAKLRYKAYGKRLDMDEYVLKGNGVILCNTIQFLMENNNEGIERNLNIYEINKKKLLRYGKGIELDFELFKALYARDKAKIEEQLEKLLAPRMHKRRTNNIILDKFISLPALGFAKLAWRHGIEVNVDNRLIPCELLPIQPNEYYEVSYDFLKEPE